MRRSASKAAVKSSNLSRSLGVSSIVRRCRDVDQMRGSTASRPMGAERIVRDGAIEQNRFLRQPLERGARGYVQVNALMCSCVGAAVPLGRTGCGQLRMGAAGKLHIEGESIATDHTAGRMHHDVLAHCIALR